MPDPAASLRPTGPSGLATACVLALPALLAGEAGVAANRPAKDGVPSAKRPASVGQLWAAFPLAEPRPRSARPVRTRPVKSAARRARVVATPGVQDTGDTGRWLLLGAVGASAFASAVLFALFGISAWRSRVLHRLALARRRRRSTPRDALAPVGATGFERELQGARRRTVPPTAPGRAAEAGRGGDGRAAVTRRPEGPSRAVTPAPPRYLLFLATGNGYALVEADGEPPTVGTWVPMRAGAEGRYRVAKVGPSPLPRDARLCVYLEQW